MSGKNDKIESLAIDVLNLSRNTLVINLRFMDKAISMLKCQSTPGIKAIAVNASAIFYDPVTVLKRFSKEKKQLTRQYLHMVLHCVYQHFWISTLVNQEYWNLACDIAVEYTINDINLDSLQTESSEKQRKEIDKLRKKVKYMTADMLYRFFVTEKPPVKEIRRLQKLFSADIHDAWYSPLKWERQISAPNSDIRKSEPDIIDKKYVYKSGNEPVSGNNYETEDIRIMDFSKEELEDIRKEWEDTARQMRIDLDSFSKGRGIIAGGLTQNLLAVTREKYDYSTFLRKFGVLGERMRINLDEFDYVFYTYGLKLYERMPLIEPLEYKDATQVRELVIAIDTSGSTSGELVQRFLQKTYSILKDEESFFRRFNLHIIQCDAEIQEDAKITNQDEFDSYIGNMQIKGQGGTDFRPVFKYVDELVANREFTNLKGLIYFTDGEGIYPVKQPLYRTAFVFLEEGYDNPQVPVWAIKLVLQPDDIKEM